MIIWTGWGFIVPFLFGGIFFMTMLMAVRSSFSFPAVYTLAAIINAICLVYLARALDKNSEKVMIEKKTGKEVILKKNHTLYFIPIKIWL